MPALTWQAPCITGGPLDGYCYQDFLVTSFGDIHSFAGSIDGRVIARGDVFLDPDGVTIGVGLRTNQSYCQDAERPYSLVMGGDSLCWSHGQLFPDGSVVSHFSVNEGIFAPVEMQISDCFPPHLNVRQTGECPVGDVGDCLEPALDAMQTYYTDLVEAWCAPENTNTQWYVQDTQLIIRSKNTTATTLYVSIHAEVLNAITYFDLQDFEDFQEVVITVHEDASNCDDPPRFGSGAPFPWPPHRTAFAFCPNNSGCQEGTYRRLIIEGGVGGSLIAPYHSLLQMWGVVTGFVVALDVEAVHNIALPGCIVCPSLCGDGCCRTDAGDECCANTTCCDASVAGGCCGASCGCDAGQICCGDGTETEACCDESSCCNGVCCEDGQGCCNVGGVPTCCGSGNTCCPLSSDPTGEAACCNDFGGLSECCGFGCGCDPTDACCLTSTGEGACCESCCPISSTEGDRCCSEGQSCCINGAGEGSCCDSDQACCNGECCAADVACCNDLCCPDATDTCCGTECCSTLDSAQQCCEDQCCNGTCCASGCCETACCGEGDACCTADQVCCDDVQQGDVCCDNCIQDEGTFYCCPVGVTTICNGACCDVDDTACCANGDCCLSGDDCCGNACCEGNCCDDNSCCGSQSCCGSTCCQSGEVCCGDDTCCSAELCCGEECCADDQACCEGSCQDSCGIVQQVAAAMAEQEEQAAMAEEELQQLLLLAKKHRVAV